LELIKLLIKLGFPDGSVVKNLPANAGDTGLIPQPGIEPTPQALEGKLVTTGPPGKSPH